MPVQVSGITWSARQKRTRIPPAPLHDEWTVRVRLGCETEFLMAVVLWDVAAGLGRFNRGWSNTRGIGARVDVGFRPSAWDTTDDVDILTGSTLRAHVSSAAVKLDPRSATTIDVAADDAISTGVPHRLLHIPEVGVAIDVFLVRSSDTVKSHGRWRLRSPDADVPDAYDFLRTGQVCGTISPA